jgi:hypothetical protein
MVISHSSRFHNSLVFLFFIFAGCASSLEQQDSVILETPRESFSRSQYDRCATLLAKLDTIEYRLPGDALETYLAYEKTLNIQWATQKEDCHGDCSRAQRMAGLLASYSITANLVSRTISYSLENIGESGEQIPNISDSLKHIMEKKYQIKEKITHEYKGEVAPIQTAYTISTGDACEDESLKKVGIRVFFDPIHNETHREFQEGMREYCRRILLDIISDY